MPQKPRKKPPTGKKICKECKKEKSLSLFYTTSNEMVSDDGRTVNICKSCVKNGSYNADGSLNIELFKQKLMLMDKPFVPDALEASIKEVNHSLELGKGRTDVIGCYFKNIATLTQYSKLSFLQSLSLLEQGKDISSAVTATEKKNAIKDDEVYIKQVDNFVVTDEIVDLFGDGYSKSSYKRMVDKFQKIKKDYPLQTNLHVESLASYVRFKVKEEEATIKGDVGGAEKWSRMAQQSAENAKITPKQLSQSDLQGGITCFSDIFKGVEQAVDVIPILPRFKYKPNDALDFNIWCYINYARNLQGLPECEYKDVYEFYDKKKKEYIEQYGDPYRIFDEDPVEKNRPGVEKFITLPKEFQDGDD